jgi:integrase
MLTITQIERAKAPVEGRIVIWDHDLPGFGVRVFPSGKRSFILRYRLPGSRQKETATLGTYGPVTLIQARSRAKELLQTVRRGGDPQADRKARAVAAAKEAQALTAARLVEQYLAALKAGTVSSKRLRGQRATPAYLADIALHLCRFSEHFGRQVAGEVTRADVVSVLNDVIEQPSVHRRMHGAIHRMFAWARRSDLVAHDPTSDIETRTAVARERVLSLAELAAIWRAATQLDPLYRDLIHLLILTGQRRTEVAGMRWCEIDLEKALWTIPNGRTKARRQHIIPLPPAALAILKARRTFDVDVSGFVLPTLSRDGRTATVVSGWSFVKRDLDQRSGVTGWQFHDFRRSLVTLLAEQGIDIAVLDSLLNHAASTTRGGVIGVYQKAILIEPMRKLMAIWDELIGQAVNPASEKTEVRLPRKKPRSG